MEERWRPARPIATRTDEDEGHWSERGRDSAGAPPRGSRRADARPGRGAAGDRDRRRPTARGAEAWESEENLDGWEQLSEPWSNEASSQEWDDLTWSSRGGGRRDQSGTRRGGWTESLADSVRLAAAHTRHAWEETSRHLVPGSWRGEDDDFQGGGALGLMYEESVAAPQKRRFLASRRSRVIAIICLAVVLVATLGSVPVVLAGAGQVRTATAQSKDGLQHLKNAQTYLKLVGQNPFDATSVASAHAELAAANGDFAKIDHTLKSMPGVAAYVPIAGSKFSAAQQVVPVALEATQAGMIGCDMLTLIISRLKNPLDANSQGVTTADLAVINADFAQVSSLATTIISQVNQWPSSVADLDPRLGPAIAGLRANLPAIQQGLSDAKAVVALFPQLLGVGQPAQYMLELLDSAELRPGGGFVGSYGFLTLDGARLKDVHFRDVTLLDEVIEREGKLHIDVPAQYPWLTITEYGWGVRDSNLEPDFATDAKYAQDLYSRETQYGHDKLHLQIGGENPVGLIAITPYLIQSMLRVTGPITLPEYDNLQVNADNLIYQIHYHQLTNGVAGGPGDKIDPATGTSYRKEFTGYLFKHFMATLKDNTSKDIGPLLKVMLDGLKTKDVQVALNPTQAQKALTDAHLDSTVRSPAGVDTSFIVDANISGSKSNYDITNTVTDAITLDTNGNAQHHMTITYDWPDTPQVEADLHFGNESLYHDYLRVYVPTSAKLKSSSGWTSTKEPNAYNSQIISGDFKLHFPGKGTVTLDWSQPNAATHDATGWHYSYLVQHQAGWTRNLVVNVALPACAAIKATPTGAKTPDARTVALSEPLTNDTTLTYGYTC